MAMKSEVTSVVILSLMALLSIATSFMGLMMLGMGEACCHLKEPGGTAYAGFGWAITLTLAAFLLYAFWPPSKPIIFWIWAGMIVSFFTSMNAQTPYPASTDRHIAPFIRGLLAWPLSWVLVGLLGLSHIEARFGTRTWGKRSVQGA